VEIDENLTNEKNVMMGQRVPMGICVVMRVYVLESKKILI
jgi:hypothetical protein